VIAAVVIALFAAGVFSSDDPTAASTTVATTVVTTTTAPTTTAATTTTAVATTTTAAPTTTVTTLPPPLLSDTFTSTSPAVPFFGPEFMTWTVTDVGTLASTSPGGFVLVAMYSTYTNDATLTLDVRTDLVNPGATAGVIVYSEDPADFALDNYVMVLVVESTSRAKIVQFNGTSFVDLAEAPIPVGASFEPDGFDQWKIVLSGGTIHFSINGTLVVEGGDFGPFLGGALGFVVNSADPGDAVTVDNLIVTVP
jgi:hypothetical protein